MRRRGREPLLAATITAPILDGTAAAAAAAASVAVGLAATFFRRRSPPRKMRRERSVHCNRGTLPVLIADTQVCRCAAAVTVEGFPVASELVASAAHDGVDGEAQLGGLVRGGG